MSSLISVFGLSSSTLHKSYPAHPNSPSLSKRLTRGPLLRHWSGVFTRKPHGQAVQLSLRPAVEIFPFHGSQNVVSRISRHTITCIETITRWSARVHAARVAGSYGYYRVAWATSVRGTSLRLASQK